MGGRGDHGGHLVAARKGKHRDLDSHQRHAPEILTANFHEILERGDGEGCAGHRGPVAQPSPIVIVVRMMVGKADELDDVGTERLERGAKRCGVADP